WPLTYRTSDSMPGAPRAARELGAWSARSDQTPSLDGRPPNGGLRSWGAQLHGERSPGSAKMHPNPTSRGRWALSKERLAHELSLDGRYNDSGISQQVRDAEPARPPGNALLLQLEGGGIGYARQARSGKNRGRVDPDRRRDHGGRPGDPGARSWNRAVCAWQRQQPSQPAGPVRRGSTN